MEKHQQNNNGTRTASLISFPKTKNRHAKHTQHGLQTELTSQPNRRDNKIARQQRALRFVSNNGAINSVGFASKLSELGHCSRTHLYEAQFRHFGKSDWHAETKKFRALSGRNFDISISRSLCIVQTLTMQIDIQTHQL